ncbi:ribonuclease E activity regulator RraA [Novosphingobium sp.]|uniref:ribonuclease E activity regulator RraA n=1 Tax=Novosphingobium sp. TaxID=1874826 RepID=UPI0025E0451F|nr:ribonuclease E activity regulator RraA [Novosphingobium sp.]
MSFTTCDLYDEHGDAARVLGWSFRDFGGRTRFAGEVETVKCFEDNSRIKELASTPGRGRVLVVDGGGSRHAALLGDMIATQAIASGWAGFVIYGSVRDSAVLKTLDIGIKALRTTPRKSIRLGEGQVGVPLAIAGVEVRPGDRLYADEDGILLLAAPK